MGKIDDLKDEVLKDPSKIKKLSALQMIRVATKLSAEEKQFIKDYHNQNVDINNNPNTPPPNQNLNGPPNNSMDPVGVRAQRLPPLPPKKNGAKIFLITEGVCLVLFSLIIFSIADFSFSTAVFMDYLMRIGIAALLSLIIGGILSLMLARTGKGNQSFLIIAWICVFVDVGLSALFCGLFCGWDWNELTAGLFLAACIVAIPASALLGLITGIAKPSSL